MVKRKTIICIFTHDPHPARIGKLRKILKEANLDFTNMGVGISNTGGCFVTGTKINKIKKLLKEKNATEFFIVRKYRWEEEE